MIRDLLLIIRDYVPEELTAYGFGIYSGESLKKFNFQREELLTSENKLSDAIDKECEEYVGFLISRDVVTDDDFLLSLTRHNVNVCRMLFSKIKIIEPNYLIIRHLKIGNEIGDGFDQRRLEITKFVSEIVYLDEKIDDPYVYQIRRPRLDLNKLEFITHNYKNIFRYLCLRDGFPGEDPIEFRLRSAESKVFDLFLCCCNPALMKRILKMLETSKFEVVYHSRCSCVSKNREFFDLMLDNIDFLLERNHGKVIILRILVTSEFPLPKLFLKNMSLAVKKSLYDNINTSQILRYFEILGLEDTYEIFNPEDRYIVPDFEKYPEASCYMVAIKRKYELLPNNPEYRKKILEYAKTLESKSKKWVIMLENRLTKANRNKPI